MNYQTLIGIIKQECKRQNISTYRLAQISGIPTSTIYGIFRGKNKAQMDTICMILDALGLEIVIKPLEQKNIGFSCELDVLPITGVSKEKRKVLEKLARWLSD